MRRAFDDEPRLPPESSGRLQRPVRVVRALVHGGRLAHCAGGGVSNGVEPAATSTPVVGAAGIGNLEDGDQMARAREEGTPSRLPRGMSAFGT